MKFLADNELGKLAKLLRMLGLDCLYEGGAARSKLLARAAEEQRLFISNHPIAETLRLKSLKIEELNPDQQLLEVLKKCDLSGPFPLFSRCLECNSSVQKLPSCDNPDGNTLELLKNVPASVRERGLTLQLCPGCRRIYWEGSHIKRMRQRLKNLGVIKE